MKIILLQLTLILLCSFAQAQERQTRQSDKKPVDNSVEQKQNNQPKSSRAADIFKPSEKVSEDHPAVFPADI